MKSLKSQNSSFLVFSVWFCIPWVCNGFSKSLIKLFFWAQISRHQKIKQTPEFGCTVLDGCTGQNQTIICPESSDRLRYFGFCISYHVTFIKDTVIPQKALKICLMRVRGLFHIGTSVRNLREKTLNRFWSLHSLKQWYCYSWQATVIFCVHYCYQYNVGHWVDHHKTFQFLPPNDR